MFTPAANAMAPADTQLAAVACAMGSMLSRLPYNRGPGCDLHSVVAELAGCPAGRARAS